MSASRRRGRRILRLDLATFVLGWALVFQQAIFVDPTRVNEAFLWLAGALLGVPGTAEIVTRTRGGTAGSASPSASLESPSSSPTSSSADPVP